MSRAPRIAAAIAGMIVLGLAIEAARVATILTNMGAPVSQALTIARGWIASRHGLTNGALWAALLFGLFAAMLAIGARRNRAD